MTPHLHHTPPLWQLVNTVHSERKLLFCMAPGHERLVATLVSGSREELQRFKADARLMAASPQLLGAPGFKTGIADPDTGRNLSSYQLLPELEAIVRAAKQVP